MKNKYNKRVLIIITKAVVGGAQMSVFNLAKGFKNKGIDVEVAFGEGEFLRKKLDKIDIKHHNFKYLKRTHNPVKNLFFIWEIKKFLNKNKYDVVHFNSSNALIGVLGAKNSKYRPKTVFTLRGLSLLDINYKKHPLLRKIYKYYFIYLLKHTDEAVCVSKINHDYIIKQKIAPKASVVLNGLNPEDLKFIDKEKARQEISKYTKINIDNKFIIGSIGRLDYAKNFEFLIRIFPELLKIKPESILFIIGEGNERDKYIKLIKENNLEDNIIFAGKIPDAAKFIKAFDLFSLPSRYEGLSITLIEALFAGVPILTSKVGGNPELVDSIDQIYELNNGAEFLIKFKEISTNKDLRDRLSLQNKEQAQKFHISNTINQYLNIYYN